MIEKTIHYCWFGGKEKPELAKKCLESWKKFCPDWKIMEWNEENYDVNGHPYTAYCHAHGKWAFLSDFVRLDVVSKQGGVYLDTDVELVKPLDSLLEYAAFYGFENSDNVNTGHGFGAEQGHPTVEAMLAVYQKLEPGENGDYALTACPWMNTKALKKLGLQCNGEKQEVAGAVILPADYLNPYEYTTGKMQRTENTLSIHWYNQSWVEPKKRLLGKLTKPFHRIFGVDCFKWLKRK